MYFIDCYYEIHMLYAFYVIHANNPLFEMVTHTIKNYTFHSVFQKLRGNS